RFQDIDFDPVGAAKQVGYSSLRMGMLDALRQIGTPEATELSLQTLQTTADPQEIGLLAKGLEKQLPADQFRSVALAAASQRQAVGTGPPESGSGEGVAGDRCVIGRQLHSVRQPAFRQHRPASGVVKGTNRAAIATDRSDDRGQHQSRRQAGAPECIRSNVEPTTRIVNGVSESLPQLGATLNPDR